MAIVSQTFPLGGWKDYTQSARRISSEIKANDRYDLKLAGGGPMILSQVPVRGAVFTQDQPECSSNTRLCTKIAQLDQIVEAAEMTRDPNEIAYLEEVPQPVQHWLFLGYA